MYVIMNLLLETITLIFKFFFRKIGMLRVDSSLVIEDRNIEFKNNRLKNSLSGSEYSVSPNSCNSNSTLRFSSDIDHDYDSSNGSISPEIVMNKNFSGITDKEYSSSLMCKENSTLRFSSDDDSINSSNCCRFESIKTFSHYTVSECSSGNNSSLKDKKIKKWGPHDFSNDPVPNKSRTPTNSCLILNEDSLSNTIKRSSSCGSLVHLKILDPYVLFNKEILKSKKDKGIIEVFVCPKCNKIKDIDSYGSFHFFGQSICRDCFELEYQNLDLTC